MLHTFKRLLSAPKNEGQPDRQVFRESDGNEDEDEAYLLAEAEGPNIA